jgi:hypothetical protein
MKDRGIVAERTDTAPKGVIWVVGSARFQNPPRRTLAQTVEPREVDMMIRFRQQQSEAERAALMPTLVKVQSLIHKDVRSDRPSSIIANMGDADADAAVLTEAEVEKFVRQYLYRSIPAAAQQFGALIATSDVGELESTISEGLKRCSGTACVLATRRGRPCAGEDRLHPRCGAELVPAGRRDTGRRRGACP